MAESSLASGGSSWESLAAQVQICFIPLAALSNPQYFDVGLVEI